MNFCIQGKTNFSKWENVSVSDFRKADGFTRERHSNTMFNFSSEFPMGQGTSLFFFSLKMVFKKNLKQSASAFKAKHCGFKRFSWSTKKLSTASSLSAQLRCNLIKTSIIQGYGCAKPFYQHSHQRYYWLLLFFSVAFSICIYSSQWLKKKRLLTTCMQHLAICCWRVAFTFFSFAAVVLFKQSVHHGNNTV